MGLIPPVHPCDVPDAPEGCTALFDMGERIVETVLARLENFVTEDCECSNLDGYVSLGPPPIIPDRCDLVAAFLVGYGPRFGSLGGGDTLRTSSRFVARWRIQLWEGCYPMPQGNEQPIFPELELMHEVHRHLHAHATSAWDAMWEGWADGSMYPACDPLEFTDMTALEPAGPCVGFTWEVAGRVPFEQP